MAARGLLGKTLAYGFGVDFELGAGVPTSFAYAAHLYPLGVGVAFGPTGYFALFGGIGTSGVTTLVPSALELPLEARLELDVTPFARVGARASVSWDVGAPERARSALLGGAASEVAFGAMARFGKTRRLQDHGALGSGYFFAFERREMMASAWLALVFGVEMDAAY